jgi:hypothetical protein
MMMTFIPESIRLATETFSPVSAGILALLAAIVITGFWEFLIEEIKLKRLDQKRRRMTATNQNIESGRDGDRDNAIDVGAGSESAANAESVQSTLRHFDRAVERLQKLDGNLISDNPSIDRVTQDLDSDLRGLWSARDLAKGDVQGSKNLPVLLHGNGSKGKLRRQERQPRYRQSASE